jgi:hypothetical protein
LILYIIIQTNRIKTQFIKIIVIKLQNGKN